jgi:ligand-binding sensor domain-containing protein
MNQLMYIKLIFLVVLVTLIFSCKKNDNPAPEAFKFPSKVINKIAVESTGVKWFATEKGVISYDNTTWTKYSDNQNLTSGSISDFVFEKLSGMNKLWLGTDFGSTVFDFGTSKVSVANYKTKNSRILSDTVSALGIDNSSVKYIGTSKGLSILKADKWDQFLGRRNEEILAMYKISSVATSTNGYVYAATQGCGVSRFKYTDAVSGATTFSRPWASGLPSDTVYTVFVDGDAQWYGTFRGAAYHSSEFTKSDWATYTRANGLVCDSVYAIAKDLSGNMWFGTYKGVSKLSISTTDTIWTNYTTKDGLIANKVNTIAADLDGSIWFGTDNGISHYTNNKWQNY